MGTTVVLGLFGAFGIVCALVVPVVGFALTAVTIAAAFLVLWAVAGGPFGPWFLLGAFVAMQGGYVLGVIGSALVLRVRRASAEDPREPPRKGPQPIEGNLPIHPE